MMRRTILLFAVISLALLPAARAGAGSSDSSPLRFDVDIRLETTFWEGTVRGDLEGTYRWDGTAAPVVTGKVWHYEGRFTITTDEGFITGYGRGVYNLQPGSKGLSYRANGRVDDASASYEHLIGYKYHEGGVTTLLPPPIDAEGSGFFAKAGGGGS